MAWEYKIEPIFNPKRTEAVLNSLADEGWRLVAAFSPPPDARFREMGAEAKGPFLILEREKREGE